MDTAEQMTTEAVPELMALGLTGYEARAYAALVRGSATATDVARLADLPRQRIYDVLENLLDKGLASVVLGGVAEYTAVTPERAVERLLERRRRHLVASERAGEILVQTLRPAYEVGRQQRDPGKSIEVLGASISLSEYLAQSRGGVKRQLLMLAKRADAIWIADDVEWLELARKGIVRTVYQISILKREADAEWIRRLILAGEQARFVRELPVELAIVDAATVAFAIADPAADLSRSMTVVVEQPALAGVLKLAFRAVWYRGLTFDQASGRLAAAAGRTAGQAPLAAVGARGDGLRID